MGLLVVMVLAAAGCGGGIGASPDEEESSTSALGTAMTMSEVEPAPDGASGAEVTSDAGPVGRGETAPGTELGLREPAVIAMESRGERGVVEVTVVEIAAGDVPALRAFGVGATQEGGPPYYVTVSVKNLGDSALAFASIAQDFHAVLDDGSRAGEVGTLEDFRPCRTTPAPANFRKGRSFETCRVFVAPSGGTVDAVAYEGYRSPYADDPIIWRP